MTTMAVTLHSVPLPPLLSMTFLLIYDADQWGVMHDGKTPYPGAVDCIDRLSKAGKKIVSVLLLPRHETQSRRSPFSRQVQHRIGYVR